MPILRMWIFTQDDQINLDADLVDENGAVVDLTNFDTFTLRVEGIGVADPAGTPFTASSPTPSQGLVRYTVSQGDFAAGRYRCQFRAVDTGTQTLNSEVFELLVKPSVGE